MPLPLLLTYSNATYGIANYSVKVQWEMPNDAGGMRVDNFTVILHRDKMIIEMTILNANTVEHVLSLNYSTNYTLGVYASNCIGSGNSTFIHFFQGEGFEIVILFRKVSLSNVLCHSSAGCGQPTPPISGSIKYDSTEEGTELWLMCDEGDRPYEWNTSKCENSMWSPDPQLLHCVPGDQGK